MHGLLCLSAVFFWLTPGFSDFLRRPEYIELICNKGVYQFPSVALATRPVHLRCADRAHGPEPSGQARDAFIEADDGSGNLPEYADISLISETKAAISIPFI